MTQTDDKTEHAKAAYRHVIQPTGLGLRSVYDPDAETIYTEKSCSTKTDEIEYIDWQARDNRIFVRMKGYRGVISIKYVPSDDWVSTIPRPDDNDVVVLHDQS